MIIFSFELYFRNHTTVDFPYDIGVTSLIVLKESGQQSIDKDSEI